MQETKNACSLDRSSQLERLDEIAALASRALLDATPTERGVRLRLRHTDAVQAELWRLIDAEKECCPFLHFSMQIADGEVLLDVSGPADARPLIHQLFRLKTAAA